MQDQEIFIEDLLKEYPNNRHCLFTKAFLAKQRGHFRKAKKYYEDTITNHPDSFEAYVNLGNLYKNVFQEYALAKLNYETAITHFPYLYFAHSNLAVLFHENIGDYKAAIHH